MKNAINILLASICLALIFLTKNTNSNKSEKIIINQTSKDIVIQKDDVYENAKKIAKKENKSMILVFGANWCVWCQKFEHDTLTSSRSISAVESHDTIIVKINVDKINKKMKLGNIVMINERAIRGLTEIDGNGIMEDMFLRSKESLIVKDTFANSEK